MKIKLNIYSVSAFLGFALLLCSCGSNEDLPMKPLNEQVKNYYDMTNPKQTQVFEKGFSAYFDLSDGMEYAYESLRDNLARVASLVSHNDEWTRYKLGNDSVILFTQSDTDNFNDLVRKRYTDIKAPIDKALEQIIRENKRALLVTDFENYKYQESLKKNAIDESPYARKYFADWLKKGGIIKFYVVDFQENNLNKKLFFVLFDSKDRVLVDKFEYSFKKNGFKEFELSAEPIDVYTKYDKKGQGGYMGNEGLYPVTYYENKGGESDFYEIGYSWNDFASDEDNKGKLFSKLYIKMNPLYKLKKIDVEVNDVSDDLDNYSRYVALSEYEPDTEISEADTIINPKWARVYYNLDGSIKPEYVYSQQKAFPLKDFVVMERNDTDEENSEITIRLDDEFFGDNWENIEQTFGVIDDKIIRMDVYLDGYEAMPDEDSLKQLFLFQSCLDIRNGKKTEREIVENNCIVESIKLALKDVVNNDIKNVYTYFLVGPDF